MNLEVSVSTADAKADALQVLRSQGHEATSGPVRLAHPFTIAIERIDHQHATGVVETIAQLDATMTVVGDLLGRPGDPAPEPTVTTLLDEFRGMHEVATRGVDGLTASTCN